MYILYNIGTGNSRCGLTYGASIAARAELASACGFADLAKHMRRLSHLLPRRRIRAILDYIIYCTVLQCTINYTIDYTILYYTIPYHTIPYHTIPYYTILYYTILYYTIDYTVD